MEESTRMEYEKRLKQLTPDQLDHFIKYLNVLREYRDGTSTLADVARVASNLPDGYANVFVELFEMQENTPA